MITKIGFKNFRKFKEMNAIELSSVNMFVGGNNAGKSTVVKALLLVVDFLKSTISKSRCPKFRFDGYGAHDVNIDTFRRALCWDSEDENIIFYLTIDQFDISLCIEQESKDDSSFAIVKYVTIKDASNGLTLTYEISGSHNLIVESDADENIVNQINRLTEEEKNFSATIKYKTEALKSAEGSDASMLIAELTGNKQRLAECRAELELLYKKKAGGFKTSLALPYQTYNEEFNWFSSCANYIAIYSDSNNLTSVTIKLLKNFSKNLDKAIKSVGIDYIYAHSATQKVLFNKKDENDYVSKSVAELFNQRITYKTQTGKLLLDWLRKFECGDFSSYKIESIEGEAYKFVFKKGKSYINLADMGRGTIQLVILLVRIITIIKNNKNNGIRSLVMVEEPEQNLHPSLQAQLAELFYEVSSTYAIGFIIETHSEYMIRQTQIIMAKFLKTGNTDEVPMKVFYFPKDEQPYDMGFQKNGKFCKPFGPGFFNVSDDAAMQLFEMED